MPRLSVQDLVFLCLLMTDGFFRCLITPCTKTLPVTMHNGENSICHTTGQWRVSCHSRMPVVPAIFLLALLGIENISIMFQTTIIHCHLSILRVFIIAVRSILTVIYWENGPTDMCLSSTI